MRVPDNRKRDRKTLQNLRRTPAQKSIPDRVLIVCEGRFTEPTYFKGLCRYLRLRTTDIQICHSPLGTDPMNVVKYAIERFNQEKRHGDAYDRVYCVFDKDSHANYLQALNLIKNKAQFYFAQSVPCFEFWLLLHFRCSTSPYVAKGARSAGDALISDLKTFLTNYDKKSSFDFAPLYQDSLLNLAISNAKHVLKQIGSDSDNPSTYVHELIEYLIDLSKKSTPD